MERKTLGGRIGALRREKGWTQLELAEKMAVTDKAVSKWERDLSWPDAASLPKLAALFGLTIDQLIGGMDIPRADGLAQKAEGKSRVASLFLLICKALPTALGVATAALAALGELDTRSGFVVLGLCLACVGIVLLSSEKQ